MLPDWGRRRHPPVRDKSTPRSRPRQMGCTRTRVHIGVGHRHRCADRGYLCSRNFEAEWQLQTSAPSGL